MLPKTTRARLALYRERATDPKRINKDWRAHRYARTWEPNFHNWSEDRREIYADERDTLGEYLGDWESFDSWMAREATGFYTDSWCDDVIKGGVERIRSSRGVFMFRSLTAPAGMVSPITWRTLNECQKVRLRTITKRRSAKRRAAHTTTPNERPMKPARITRSNLPRIKLPKPARKYTT